MTSAIVEGRFMREFRYAGADGFDLHAVSTGAGPVVVLMHGGGPDHRSLLPLAERLSDRYTVVLPDVRGYGRSVCPVPELHTWAQYSRDVVTLLDHLGQRDAVLGGTGLGGTIALRTALTHEGRVRAVVLISVEDIEDDAGKEAETALFDEFAARVRSEGIEAGWAPILPTLAPVIGTLVREAIGRSDPASVAAAAAIGHDRAFRAVEDLAALRTPALVVPGSDDRHPTELAEKLAATLPRGELSPARVSTDLRTAEDLAAVVAPSVRAFLDDLHG